MLLVAILARRIRAAREGLGLTQEALAERAGITREYLARLETGRQDPRVSVVARLARALNTTLDGLVSEAGRGPMTMKPTRQNFEDALTAVLATAVQQDHHHVDVRAGDLHRRVGGYPAGGDHRMPLCCQVMKRIMGTGDRVLQEPASGQGATLTIRYRLPRS